MKNIIKEIKTTIIGLGFLIPVFIFLFEHANTLNELSAGEMLVGAIVSGIGIGLLFARDRFLDWLFSFAKKKTGTDDSQ